MLFSKSAALRILPQAKTIEEVRPVRGVILVCYTTRHGRCATFVSRKAFANDFVEVRKTASEGLVSVKVDDTTFRVASSKAGRDYIVRVWPNAIACYCSDYEEQKRQFGKGVCKHGYHVLNHWLGYGSLGDYLKRVQAIAS